MELLKNITGNNSCYISSISDNDDNDIISIDISMKGSDSGITVHDYSAKVLKRAIAIMDLINEQEET